MAEHPRHQHHYRTMEQQRQAASLGMWLFLAQEIMFFGGLFTGYIVYRTMYPEAFMVGSEMLSIGWGGFNTVVLIFSSLTVALAVRAAQLGRQKQIVGFIAATMFLGIVFLGVKVIEYKAKFDHQLVPGRHFVVPAGAAHHQEDERPGAAHKGGAGEQGGHAAAPDANAREQSKSSDAEAHDQEASLLERASAHVPQSAKPIVGVEIFYSFYFGMTGMHALHMIIGIGIMVWLLKLAMAGRFDPQYYAPVELFGLYWHFVDIIWIFLFPLLYLIGRHM